MSEMPITVLAKAYGGPNGPIHRVVLHDEEYPVTATSAEAIARYFASPVPGTSAHYVVDADSVQHCVPEDRIAYHAPPNYGSLGIEHDGFARFSAAEWLLPGSAATLRRSAVLCAEIVQRRVLPVRFITASDLVANPDVEGITTHAEVTAAFHKSTHTDPGAHFPIDAYLGTVAALVNPSPLLQLGSTGPKVADVQRALNKCGNQLRVDGVMGTDTVMVLTKFQQHRSGAPLHLPVTGTTDLATWAALRAVAHPTK